MKVKVGQRVSHPKYGEGIVIESDSEGSSLSEKIRNDPDPWIVIQH